MVRGIPNRSAQSTRRCFPKSATGYTVPFDVKSDELINMELGWKLDMLNNTLRFNGSVFFLDISDLQTTIFDTSIVNLFFSDNAADAEVTGLEGDITWAPTGNLTMGAAFSFLDTEITDTLRHRPQDVQSRDWSWLTRQSSRAMSGCATSGPWVTAGWLTSCRASATQPSPTVTSSPSTAWTYQAGRLANVTAGRLVG